MTALQQSLDYLHKEFQTHLPIDTLLVLGSGFKVFVDELNPIHQLELDQIPGVTAPKVQGHGSSLMVAEIEGRKCFVQTGRIHLYEDHSAATVVYLQRCLAKLGVKNLVVTNAAGGLSTNYQPGDIAILVDHLNLTNQNCLVKSAAFGEQFVDMTNAYDKQWRSRVQSASSTKLKEAIYGGVLGPTYETPAETKMLASLGATVAGMSTVQEVIAARQMGVKVCGFSFVTNLAAGLTDQVNHEEVLAIGKERSKDLAAVLKTAVKTIDN